jgi:hypothetical protein
MPCRYGFLNEIADLRHHVSMVCAAFDSGRRVKKARLRARLAIYFLAQ